jgi:hypothetical protein
MDTDQIKTGDILLVSGKWLLARMIQKVTRSKWNHAGVMVWLWGELFVAEAEKEGLQLTRWDGSKYCNGYPQDRELMIMRCKVALPEKEVAMFIMPLMGRKRYDFFSLVFHQVIWNLVKVWTGKREERADDRFYCSEFAAYVVNHFQPTLFGKWWTTNPGMLDTEHPESFEQFRLNY